MSTKPDTSEAMSAQTFDRWYWDKPELVEICVRLGLPKTGSKDALRARILTYLETGAIVPNTRRKPGAFNWARAELTTGTVITETVSFGPNFRRFMAAQIGDRFVCHADFMEWVRTHPGKTLGDAIAAWHRFDARHDDPAFRRDIAPHNNYLQYLRDYRDANPTHSIEAAKAAWEIRKRQPIEGDRIVYRAEDAGQCVSTSTARAST